MAEQQTEVDFATFTAAEDGRYAISKPFVLKGWKYATDAFSIIAQPTDEPDTEAGEAKPPPIEDLPWYRFEHERSRFTAPEESEPIPDEMTCPDCEGRGIEGRPCQDCDGDGWTECPRCGNEDDCDTCAGYGVIGSRKQCERCGGGKVIEDPDHYRRLGGVKVQSRYYHAIMSMPEAEISSHPDKPESKGVLFRAAGDIKGMVMPCKDD